MRSMREVVTGGKAQKMKQANGHTTIVQTKCVDSEDRTKKTRVELKAATQLEDVYGLRAEALMRRLNKGGKVCAYRTIYFRRC
jgi:hypothetical protein